MQRLLTNGRSLATAQSGRVERSVERAMRLRLGPIPTSADFHPEEDGWTRAAEPREWVTRWILSIPSTIILTVVALVAVIRFTPISSAGMSPGGLLATFVVLIVVHEAVHALLHPDYSLTDKTVVGFWPSRLIFYAHYDAPRSRERFLLCCIGPLLVLTVLPVTAAAVFELEWWWLGAIAIANAYASGIDIIGFVIATAVIPRGAQVRNQGWYTYWRARPAA